MEKQFYVKKREDGRIFLYSSNGAEKECIDSSSLPPYTWTKEEMEKIGFISIWDAFPGRVTVTTEHPKNAHGELLSDLYCCVDPVAKSML